MSWLARCCGGFLVMVAIGGCASQPPANPPERQLPAAGGISVPVEYYKLDNGLKVVLSRDTSAPTVTVGIYYHIGFRIEDAGRA